MNIRNAINIPSYYISIRITYSTSNCDVIHDAINHAEKGEFEKFPFDNWDYESKGQFVDTVLYVVTESIPSEETLLDICEKMATNLKNKYYNNVTVTVTDKGIDSIDKDTSLYASEEHQTKTKQSVKLR